MPLSESVVNDWIEYQQRSGTIEDQAEDERLFLAWEAIDEYISNFPEVGFAYTLRLIEASPNDKTLASIGAGPLESLIVRHPESMIDKIELQALENSQFRRCLTAVWCEGDVPSNIYARLEKIVLTESNPL